VDLALLGRLLAACIVIALVLGAVQIVAARLGRARFDPGGGRGRLVALVETVYLPGAASLHVVRVAERYYVVGRNAAALVALAQIPPQSVESWLTARASPPGNPVAPVLRFASRFAGRRR